MNAMTVDDLIQVLTDLSEAGLGDRTLRCATQQSYPLICNFDGVYAPEDAQLECDCGRPSACASQTAQWVASTVRLGEGACVTLVGRTDGEATLPV